MMLCQDRRGLDGMSRSMSCLLARRTCLRCTPSPVAQSCLIQPPVAFPLVMQAFDDQRSAAAPLAKVSANARRRLVAPVKPGALCPPAPAPRSIKVKQGSDDEEAPLREEPIFDDEDVGVEHKAELAPQTTRPRKKALMPLVKEGSLLDGMYSHGKAAKPEVTCRLFPVSSLFCTYAKLHKPDLTTLDFNRPG